MTPTSSRYHYWIHAVIADVGWITDTERDAVTEALGPDSVVYFNTPIQHLHLDWPLTCDTMTDAIGTARADLRKATEATGVNCPRTCVFDVREIGH